MTALSKLLLLTLPQALQGFATPAILSHHAATATSSFKTAYTAASLPTVTSLGMIAESSSVIEQFGDPLLYQHMATGGVLAFAGDVIAQSLLSEANKEANKKSIPPEDWDVVRTAAFTAFGALYTGGVQHFIFGYLNTSFDEPLVRLGLAQFFFIPFCYYPTFLAMVPALRAGWESPNGFNSPEAKLRQNELFTDVAGKIPSTLVRNWFFWIPVQFVQFNFIPMDAQVTYAAAFGVIWNAILSWSTAATAQPAAKKES
mmetsp:Transcript_11264/g.24024  ORF Transcript_11264/g.24024 Transcript_11264/m.24024 type:complete len:258 (-) Transcript_11264:600-1373(-)